MNTKFLIVALLASAAFLTPAQAGRHNNNGSNSAPVATSSVRAHSVAPSSVRSFSSRNFSGNRMIYSGQRFPSVRSGSLASSNMRQHHVNSNLAARTRRVTTATGTSAQSDQRRHFSSGGNNTALNARRVNHSGNVRNGNGLRANWQNHVTAKRSANWQRNWDRHHDHNWHGHHCRFINGSWVIFNLGFDPWWPYWYPDYYSAYGGYPYSYSYDPAYYGSDVYQGEQVYGQTDDYQNGYQNDNGYQSSNAPPDGYNDSTVAAAQARLSRQGFYRGSIDGILGPETERAIAQYQRNHGLRVTAGLSPETLEALGLRQVASNY